MLSVFFLNTIPLGLQKGKNADFSFPVKPKNKRKEFTVKKKGQYHLAVNFVHRFCSLGSWDVGKKELKCCL